MKYTNKDCLKFVKDMTKIGLEVEHYRGRNFWQGPAVRVGNVHDAICFTTIACQADNMGKGYIVYPRASDTGI